MADSLIDQLKSRGEAFFTEVSNNLMANPAFLDVLKKGLLAKELLDKQVADGLKKLNVATKKDMRSLEHRIANLESELSELKEKMGPAARRTPTRARKS